MTDTFIHNTAIIDKSAKIGKGVHIGPFCTIGPDVTIGDNTKLVSHVSVDKNTDIGSGNTINAFCSIGADPQDLKHKSSDQTYLKIGDNNTIREYCSIHRGTISGGKETIVGNNNLIMTLSHIAHDCKIGNNVIISHNVGLAGHITIMDHAIISAMSGIHQGGVIGRYSFISAGAMTTGAIPPYSMFFAYRSGKTPVVSIPGANAIGLRRLGFANENIDGISKALRFLFQKNNETHDSMRSRMDVLIKSEDYTKFPEIQEIIDFLDQHYYAFAKSVYEQ